ncbi:hypothetical protein R3W88_008436 [Solanum pinnatisectum]|uniref:Protein kinase domain-containing protein n=1 Tax=Solanum pinnatisectum TaxID=50273 RepID=A0AAV9MAX3_9SOLN|nr:hypothetical protein R3W88_008436 [Solanum pinnatisectum]
MAYTNININGNGSKCVIGLGDVLDMRHSQISGNNIFKEMTPGKLDALVFDYIWKEEWTVFASLISELSLLTILLITARVSYRMRTKVLDEPLINQMANSQGALLQGSNVIAYDSSDLAATNNNFSLVNKIGHGGFGNVYKNEVKLIAKLQHCNLTKLLGYFINLVKIFLVYEFMANNSLHKVIFDPARNGTVTWPIYIVAGNKW